MTIGAHGWGRGACVAVALLAACSDDGDGTSGTGGAGATVAGSGAATTTAVATSNQSSSASTGSGMGGEGGGGDLLSFSCPGGTVSPGENTLTVDGLERIFYADFPADTTQPMGVLFSWHGFGDTMQNHRAASGLDPDADPALPVVVITPDDSGMQPPVGLDWDIAKGTAADMNRDIAFFESMLGCLDEQYEIDPTRIYSYGFSAGSVMTSLIHSRHPKLLSAIVAVSGAWFNDEAQQDLVNIFQIDWNWPALDPSDGGAVLLTHGGPNDVTVLNILSLEDAAQAAFPFLAANGRIVVDCAHDQGHTPHPDVTPALVSSFISAHRAGQPSPYATEGLDGFPASCALRLP